MECVWRVWGSVLVGVWGDEGRDVGGVGEGEGRCSWCEEVWGKAWKSVWGECGGCGKVCCGVGEVRRDVGVWRSVGNMCWGFPYLPSHFSKSPFTSP